MKRIGFFCCLIVGMSSLFAAEPAPTPVTQTRELFNGKDFTNWYTWVRGTGKNNDPKGVFTIQDGCIRVSGEEFGCITTEEAFENYRIDVEFRFGTQTWGNRKEKARDSGLLIHSVGADGAFGGIWMKSVEANIVEGGIGDFWIVGSQGQGVRGTCRVRQTNAGKVFDPAGEAVTITGNEQGCFQWSGRDPHWKDTLGFRGANDLDKPNDWNTLTVVADGDQMTVYLNGTRVNEITNVLPQCGKIQLQSEGAEIFFRRVTLRPLTR
ncbi:MAG: DUF1080 domain-containing protein [Planctomycetia bacterium]|nr:DUF1080 domain-containing protein [Planctomycetia bacterium]